MSPYNLLPRFKAQYDANNQEFSISGVVRPQAIDELGPSLALLRDAIGRVRGVLYVNVRRLTQMNNAAFHAFSRIIIDACRARPDLRFVVITSSVVGWTSRKFGRLSGIEPNITVEEYDSEFYPGQGFLEEGGFVPILRTQTKMTWRHERTILPRHGMRPGIVMADICCGLGDFVVLVQKEFQPSRIVALDHSISSLDYARRVMREFDIRGIEYTYGDASEMLLDEAQFDLVTCRHSLQIFNRPELILKELYRICKPGGRVYITNEKNSHCLGEPRAESIRWTYNEVAKLFAHFEMDVELGPKSRRYLIEAGFEDIRVETFMVTNLDGDPQDFADVIVAWADVYAGDMATRRGDGPEFIARFRQGFQDHIFAALHPKGYAGWPIWVASGRRPQ
ncbi:methyltransferase domain-containing protein [Mesorhizobium sp. M2D.F.Ca.ET.185.01.1.1]|uniref:class I SAM-dependent methyltransferase n=1 Tax=unclassified Mesorhizobium TaxID=325217 RepID=UPI000FCA906B|nr:MULTISPECIES: class I SAM-dependent methyltransferase [unclassified Mesorhizobium]TGP73847.1 methyltransferase domain-containing protein [bacterium M00.F.Ca.ET.227.01.1.1]TGP85738.1 methyltransferase domain-containing protein [bacterium M00.F.Ca.ET.221.01.1.1]TGP90965.1 methyltransferase domain-containing protein [bacterium M00.F.Ca.ET.222.01.1.1]TGU09532.1 methyltransferase domain-containing protein [bacterium M00.F.Ca.ET.163.01.1.1]TGU20674.1 methyltransferase domain-containing protein [b